MKFQLLVARDFFKVFLAMQILIWILGGWVRSSDCGTGANATAWDCVEHEPSSDDPWNDGYDPLAECCPDGDIVNHVPPFSLLKHHTRSAYYLVGLTLVCALYGAATFGGRMCGCAGDGSCSLDDCCFGRCTAHSASGCAGGLGLGCLQFGCTNVCYFLVVSVPLVLLALFLIFTVAGAMAAVMGVSVAVQRSMQRHVHVLHKRNMATQFIVEDLSGEGEGCRSLAEVLAERGGAAPNPGLQPRQSQVTRGAHEIRAAAALRQAAEQEEEEEEGAPEAQAADPEVGLLVASSSAPQQLRSSVGGRAVIDQELARRTLREVGVL